MKHFTALASIATIVVAATAAHAQPQADTDPDVSKVEGDLVEVGNHNRYRYGYPRYNLSTNPFGALIGIYSASGSAALTNRVALRVDGTFYNEVDSNSRGYELNLSVPIYFKKMYSGVFLEPGIIVREFDIDAPATAGPEVLLGYHWFFDSGLNISLALGVGRNLIYEEEDDFSSDYEAGEDKIFGNGYLRFGYAF